MFFYIFVLYILCFVLLLPHTGIFTTIPPLTAFEFTTMAVPKKKTAKSSSQTRYKTYVKTRQKTILDFVERAKRNEKGLEKISKRQEKPSKKKVTKISA